MNIVQTLSRLLAALRDGLYARKGARPRRR